jgi:hypothetical protein
LTASLSASALAFSGQAPSGPAVGREFYELRKYTLQMGPQQKLAESYFADALIPALNRLGFSTVGAFSLEIGPSTPTLYLLIPAASAETLVTADLRLGADPDFQKASAPFWSASATQPPFLRVESTLLEAFAGRPKLKLPPSGHAKRMFQLRTYESPTPAAHVRKVEMFNSGEFEIFEAAGFWPIFYGDALVGERLPQLTYMLSFPDLSAMTAMWDRFRNDPAWKKLSSDPRYASEPIVSSISNLILTPLICSQV